MSFKRSLKRNQERVAKLQQRFAARHTLDMTRIEETQEYAIGYRRGAREATERSIRYTTSVFERAILNTKGIGEKRANEISEKVQRYFNLDDGDEEAHKLVENLRNTTDYSTGSLERYEILRLRVVEAERLRKANELVDKVKQYFNISEDLTMDNVLSIMGDKIKETRDKEALQQ